MDQPPAVALTASADARPRAIETEIGAALCAIGRGKDFDLTNMYKPWLIFFVMFCVLFFNYFFYSFNHASNFKVEFSTIFRSWIFFGMEYS